MKRIAFLLCIVMNLVVPGASGDPTLHPATRVDTLQRAFGTVEQGTVVQQQFTLSNVGSAPLIIESARFTMPGMSMRVSQTIAAGESASLKVSWNTSGFSGDVEGQIVLQLNDPRLPQLVLTLSGAVEAPIEILPAPAFYLSQFQGESAAQSITIRNHRDRPLTVRTLASEGEHFTATIEESEAGRIFEVTVSGKPAAPAGRHHGTVFVHTDDPERPRLRLEVNLLVKKDIHLTESVIDFGQVDLSQIRRDPSRLALLEQSFIVTRRAGDMRITASGVDVPGVRPRVEPDTAAQRFRVDLALDPETLEPGRFEGRLELHTDDPDHPLIQLPVRLHVEP